MAPSPLPAGPGRTCCSSPAASASPRCGHCSRPCHSQTTKTSSFLPGPHRGRGAVPRRARPHRPRARRQDRVRPRRRPDLAVSGRAAATRPRPPRPRRVPVRTPPASPAASEQPCSKPGSPSNSCTRSASPSSERRPSRRSRGTAHHRRGRSAALLVPSGPQAGPAQPACPARNNSHDVWGLRTNANAIL